jgi:hypothetical protein
VAEHFDLPVLGGMKPLNRRSKVDLPAPLWPTMAMRSPWQW